METELQEVTKELDTQHIAEVQDINNCRDKVPCVGLLCRFWH